MFLSNKFFLPLITFCLLMGATQLSAQEQQPMVNVRFTALSLDSPISNIKFDSDGTAKSLFTSTVTRSLEQKYSGPPQLVFYIPETGPEGQTIKRPVAVVNLSGFSGKQVLLLFSQHPSEPGRYTVHALDDSTARTPGNSWRMFNLTPTTVAIKVGEQEPVTIKTRSDYLFRFNSDAQTSVVIQIAASTEDGWELARRSIWSHNPNLRTLVFLIPGGQGNSVQVKRINQSLNTIPQPAQPR